MATKEKENPFVLSKEFVKVGAGIYVKEFQNYYMYIFIGEPYQSKPDKCTDLDTCTHVECSVYEKMSDNTLGLLMNAKRLNIVGVGLNVKNTECTRFVISGERLSILSKDLYKAKKLPKRINSEIRPEFTEDMKNQLFRFITLRLFAYAGVGDEPKINYYANEAREIAAIVMRMNPEHRNAKAINNVIYLVLYLSCCIMWTTDGRYEYCDPDEVTWRIKDKKDYERLAMEIKMFIDRMLKANSSEVINNKKEGTTTAIVKMCNVERMEKNNDKQMPNNPSDTDAKEASIIASG